MGLRPRRMMVLISWTLNWRLPSPTKRITLLSAPSGSSLAAKAAPRTAPTEYPILRLTSIDRSRLPPPEDLTDCNDILRKLTIEDSKIRGPCH